MKKGITIKYIAFGSLTLLLLFLAVTTFVEKAKGSAFVSSHIYDSWLFVGLWGLVAISSCIYLWQKKVYKQQVVFLLHLSFLLILTGAFFTFTSSVQGTIHLRKGVPITEFSDKKQNLHTLPFEITLLDFQIEYYPGTQAPLDYVSVFATKDKNQQETAQVSMNKIYSRQGYRFYQSGYDRDLQGSRLMVKSDRYGLPVTYAGYFLLFVSMIMFFFSRKTEFRKLLRHPVLQKTIMGLLLLMSIPFSVSGNSENSLPVKIAEDFGEIQMLYHNRVCPLQTFAKDITLKLYGKGNYRGFSSEQVLLGWLFYASEWIEEPMIKVKSKELRNVLGIQGKYASFSDFFSEDGHYKLNILLQRDQSISDKDLIAADEKIQLLLALQTGTLLKIFPLFVNHEVHWFSPTDALPEDIPENEKLLVKGSFVLLNEYAEKRDMNALDATIHQLKVFQRKKAQSILLSPAKVSAEKLYNRLAILKPLAIACLLGGLLSLIYALKRNRYFVFSKEQKSGVLFYILNIILIVVALAIIFVMALKGYITQRFPLGNGSETMQFLALFILVFAFFMQRRFFLAIPLGLFFSGFVLLVSGLGAANPQITLLQPVLHSPLLSIHVSFVMMAYALLGFTAFIGLSAFLYILIGKERNLYSLRKKLLYLSVISRILLYPGVFLLTGGIFVGAVWAEVSWGTYWSWDPKETWALITLILYALPLHVRSIRLFKYPVFFHGYMLVSLLSVLMTYFGVNLLLGGMHSYGATVHSGRAFWMGIVIFLLFVLIPFFACRKYKSLNHENTIPG